MNRTTTQSILNKTKEDLKFKIENINEQINRLKSKQKRLKDQLERVRYNIYTEDMQQ